MKFRQGSIIAGMAVAGVLLGPAAASAASTDYSGPLVTDPTASVSFTYVKKPDSRKVKNIEALNYPVMCNTDDSGDGSLEDPQRLDSTGGSVRVKRGHFEYQATIPFTSTFRFFGDITRSGASGTLQFFGDVEFGQNDVRYCETDGKLDWTAVPTP